MVMIFKSDKARRFLLENGAVFTFRAHKRKRLGKDWITDRRGGYKIADVFIEERGQVNPRSYGMVGYTDRSGFGSVQDWWEEIRKLNKGKLPLVGWLYKVTLR